MRMRATMRAAVLGASGYAGSEVVRLLTTHPQAEVTYLGAKGSASLPLATVHPHLGSLRPGGLELRPIDPDAVVEAAEVVFRHCRTASPGRSFPPSWRIVEIEGTRSDLEARAIAWAVADSSLVKTAAFGEDPNPGRILQAVGSSCVEVDRSHVDVWIGATHLVHGGDIPPAYFETDDLRASARRAMAEPEFAIRVRAGDGHGRSRILGCDLSYEYVRINGEYTT